MAQARGTQTAITLYEESTYATVPATPDGQKLYVTDFSLASQQNLIDSNTLRANRSRTQPIQGNIDVTGSIGFELHAESMGTILKHLMGGNATTGADPYVHTMTLDDLPVGLHLEKDHGASISGSGKFEVFAGCRIGGATFSFPAEGFCTASLDVMGANSTLGSATIDDDATITDNGSTPFSSFLGTIQEGGGAIAYVQSAEIRLDNGLDGSSYVIGGAGVRRALPEGFATVSGSVTALFESGALLAKAIAGTESSLLITLSRGTGAGSAGNEFMSFEIGQLLYERTSPAIDGPNGILLTLPFKGYSNTAGTDLGLELIVKNAVATV